MSTPSKSSAFQQKEPHPSTYMVQDRSNLDELARLELQDQMITQRIGGLLPEQTDPTQFRSILDVGCGTGGWLIALAKAYPEISSLVGIDISDRMLSYAQTQAKAQQVHDRVTFRAMDALRMLEFPEKTFDLVNQRLGMSFLRTWDWEKLLREYQRIVKVNGVIRITEGSLGESNSPALTRLMELLLQAFNQAGHLFTPNYDGLISHLATTMTKYGIGEVQTRSIIVEYHRDPVALQDFATDMHHLFRTIAPFLRKWTRVPDDYDNIYQQMLQETQRSDFEARATILTAWGKRLHTIRGKSHSLL